MILDVMALVLISLILGSFGQVYLKLGLRNIGNLDLKDMFSEKLISVISEKNVLFGIALYGIATLFWLVVLSKSELSFVYPLIGLSYVVTALLAKVYFNETISLIRWAGIAIIIFGAVLITRS